MSGLGLRLGFRNSRRYNTLPTWMLAGASLDLDFANDRYWYNSTAYASVAAFITASGATFTRASTGTYTNSLGNVTSFASGVPRRGDLGLLIEESRTNLALRSQEFDNASWTKNLTTATADQTTAPDGTVTADLVACDGSNGQHYVAQSGAVSGTQYTFSVYVKTNTASYIHLMVGTALIFVEFNLSTGAVTQSNAGTGTLAASGFTAVANGFSRYYFTFTQSSGSTQAVRLYVLATSQNTATPVETTSVSAYLWGAQLEAGAFATSYIPTTSASVTRAADVFNMPLSPTFPITLYANVILTSDVVSARRVLCLDDGSTANRANLGRVNASGQINLLTSSGSSTIANMFSSANAFLNVNDKIAAAIASADYAVVLNNGTPATAATAGATPVGVTTMRIGNDVGGSSANNANGYIKRAAFYNNTRLTNGAMGTLTT